MFSQPLHSEPGTQTPSSRGWPERPRSPRTSVALSLSGSASVVLGASSATPSFASLEPFLLPGTPFFVLSLGPRSFLPGPRPCFVSSYSLPFHLLLRLQPPAPPLRPPSPRPGLSPGTERPPGQWAPKFLTHPVQPGAHQPPSPDPSLSHPQCEVLQGRSDSASQLPHPAALRGPSSAPYPPVSSTFPWPTLFYQKERFTTHVRWGHVSYGRLDSSG